MTLLARFLPLPLGLFLFAGFELVAASPRLFPFALPIFILSVVGVTAAVAGSFRVPSFFAFGLLLLLFLLASATFSLFLEHPIYTHLLAVAVGFGVWLLTRTIATFTFAPSRYQPYALENLVNVFSLATLFLGLVALSDLNLFLAVPLSIVILASALLIGSGTWVVFWVSKFFPRGWRDFTVVALVGIEVALATLALPVTPLVRGALVTVAFYVAIEVVRARLRGESLREELARPFLLAAILLLAILFTAQWT